MNGCIEYSAPAPSRREILRYMGCRDSDEMTEELIERCLSESENDFSYRVAYTELPTSVFEDRITIGDTALESRDLAKALVGCDSALIFAATVGLGIDRRIMKYSHSSPASAVCFAAIGAERIEALCDLFCHDMAKKYEKNGLLLRPRFSPGYGDLPLSLQRGIFGILGCEKTLGLTLNDSLLMSPTKSVTAIVGIYKKRKNDENT